MKELSKYLLVMVLELLLAGLMIADVFAQDSIKNVRYKFTGEKSRFQIDLSHKTTYDVVEDWEDRTISLLFPEINVPGGGKYDLDGAHDYIVKSAEVREIEGKTQLIINTNTDFETKIFTGLDERVLFLDVYLNKTVQNATVLLMRGRSYDERGEFRKASLQYQKALNSDPNNSEAEYRLSLLDEKSYQITDVSSNKSELAGLAHDFTSGSLNGTDEPEVRTTTISDEGAMSNIERSESQTEEHTAQGPQSDGSEIDQADLSGDINRPFDDLNNGNPVSEPDDMIGFQELLQKSGTETNVLAGLYSIAGILAFIVIVLIQRLIKLYRASKKHNHVQESKSRVRSRSDDPFKASTGNRIKVSNKQFHDAKLFARKLTKIYSQTDRIKQQLPDRSGAGASRNTTQEHTRKIETAFNTIDNSDYESETVNLTKTFRSHNYLQKSTGDKYDAARDLAGKNWETWEIAKELSMGVEEVKMALSHSKKSKDSWPAENNILNKITGAIDQSGPNLNIVEIAEKLNVGEEEVKLALKMRNGQQAAVVQ